MVKAFTLKYICTVVSFTTTYAFYCPSRFFHLAMQSAVLNFHTPSRYPYMFTNVGINVSEEDGGSAESSVCRRATPTVRLEHKIRSVSVN